MRRFLVASTGLLCCLTIAQVLMPPVPRLIYNASQSAAIGWYVLETADTYVCGDKVAALPPDSARGFAAERGYLPTHVPLLKTIWAASGDRVCFQNNRLLVPHRPTILINLTDSLGRDMPILKGCSILSSDDFLLLSTDVQASWDSRYFGPVPRENLLGKVTYLGPTLWSPAKRWAGHGE